MSVMSHASRESHSTRPRQQSPVSGMGGDARRGDGTMNLRPRPGSSSVRQGDGEGTGSNPEQSITPSQHVGLNGLA